MPQRPDIAIFINTLSGGGAERVAVTLCNEFSERGKRVHLVVINRQGAYWHMLSPRVEVFNLDRKTIWRALFPLRRYLRRYRPPRMLCFMPGANVVGVAANLLAFRPARVTISERGVFSSSVRKTGIKRIIDWVQPLFYHLADGLICVSQGVADDLRKHVALPKHKEIIIHNPTVRKELYQLKDQPAGHRWLAPNPSSVGQPPVILAVGAFRTVKNYPLLLEAFARVVKKHEARLLILGEGPERASIERQARDLGITDAIDLPGFRENPFACMARAAAFVMCSQSEGLGNALIEALVCGCPVIATDCPGGMREILGDNRYGLLVPPDNPEALAEGLSEILAHRDKALARVEAFHKEKLHSFTPEVVIPQYMRALGMES